MLLTSGEGPAHAASWLELRRTAASQAVQRAPLANERHGAAPAHLDTGRLTDVGAASPATLTLAYFVQLSTQHGNWLEARASQG